jgi:ABC-2 type transport system ATP-binding protein
MSYRYPAGREALEALDLEVGRGEVGVVLGPNGSGKSTLLRLLATDLLPGTQTLELFGTYAARPTPALRRRIGYGPDSTPHFDELTGRENARFFLELGGGSSARLGELLDEFALSPVADTPVAEYSFGMRRKLLLAGVLASDAELLLLDEPTVGLDPAAVRALGRRLRERAAGGAAVVVATNDVHAAPEWASRIVFLHRGRVVEDADPDELRRRLGGRTHLHIRFEGTLADPPRVDGLSDLHLEEGLLLAESSMGGRPLPDLIRALLVAGVEVREARVREPDLGDLFEAWTGTPLSDGGAGAAGRVGAGTRTGGPS